MVLSQQQNVMRIGGEVKGRETGQKQRIGGLSLNAKYARYSSSSYRSDAEVAEIIMYRRELSEEEIVTVETYLGRKYGLAMPSSHRMSSYDDETRTKDYYASATMERRFPLMASSRLLWGSRKITADISGQSVMQMSVRIKRAPFEWSIPFWLILLPDPSTLSVSDPCILSGEQCRDNMVYRICFNSGAYQSCDESVTIPIDEWVTQTRTIADRFKSKYPTRKSPTRLQIILASYAERQSLEVHVDEIRVVNFAPEQASCPMFRAASSAISNSELVSPNWEITNGPGITVNDLGSSIRFSGTSTSETAVYASSREVLYDNRVDEFRLKLNSATETEESPRMTFCRGRGSLSYSTRQSAWTYIPSTESAIEPPAEFVQILVDGERSWENRKDNMLGRDLVEFAEGMTYTFWIKLTNTVNYWNGIFFRGGNGDYYQEGTNYHVHNGRDRVPAVWQRPYAARLHIRHSTTTSWNNGCDGNDDLEMNTWNHVAIIIERKWMQVFFNGEVVCYTSYGRNQERIEARDRDFGAPNDRLQSVGGGIFLDDFRFYQEALNLVQVSRVASSRDPVDRVSVLSQGSSVFIRCLYWGGDTYVYENGVLKAAFPVAGGGMVSNSPVAISARYSATGQQLDFEASEFTSRERREGLGEPVFCAATGTYLQIVKSNVTFSLASSLAASETLFDSEGFLAPLTGSKLNCINDLNPDCSALWIGAKYVNSRWEWTGGSLAGTAVGGEANWADSEGSPTSGFAFINPGSCLDSTSIAGSWGACSDSCPEVEGYIVEFEAPSHQVENYATLTMGASIMSTSSVVAPSSPITWVDGPTVGVQEMKNNLLREVKSQILSNGDSRYMFANGDQSQEIIVDLGTTRQINRVGMLVESTEAARSVNNYVQVEISDSASGSDWVLWDSQGSDNNAKEIFTSSIYFGKAMTRPARRLKFTFGSPVNRVGGAAVRQLYAQQVRTTYTRLEKDAQDYSLDSPGLNLVSFSGNDYRFKSSASFGLDSEQSIVDLADYIDQLSEGDIVLGATRDQPQPVKQLFRDSFDSFVHPNSFDRIISHIPGKGIRQSVPNATWTEAVVYCRDLGKTLCPRRVICNPRTSSYPFGVPAFGWGVDGDAYMPAGDMPGDFLAIGQAFPRYEELCKSYSEINGNVPDDSETSQWFRTHVMCCEPQPEIPWVLVDQHTNLNNRMPHWMIHYSRLRMYGNAHNSWSSSAQKNPLQPGRSYIYLDMHEAYAWADYEVEFDMYIDYRGISVLLRYTDDDNYYRVSLFYTWQEVQFVRVKDGVGETLWFSTEYKYSSELMDRWHKMKVTITGRKVVLRVNDEEIFSFEDPDPNLALTEGTIGLMYYGSTNAYVDNLVVRTVASWNVYKELATEALSSLGLQSAAGIESGSWVILGTKGAPSGSVPHSASSTGKPLSIVNIFDCKTQRRIIPENSKPGRVIPRPLKMVEGMIPSGFQLRSNETTPFSVNPSTGQVMVLRGEDRKPDFETQPEGGYSLLVSAQETGFDSGWFKMGSQAGKLSFKELKHGLNIPPELLKLSVWVRPVDGPNKGFIFKGHGSAQMVDYSWVLRYGGVIGAYDSSTVRVWAPTHWQHTSSGHIVNIGEGWGGEFRDSSTVFVKEHKKQLSHLADVRVVVRRDVPPDFDSGPFLMKAEEGSASVIDIRHNLGQVPARVKVFSVGASGENAGYVFAASGSAFRDHRIWNRPMGGVIFSYDKDIVRCWVPARRQHSRNSGRVNLVGEGWGGEEKPIEDLQATVRAMAWKEDAPPDFESDWLIMSAQKSEYGYREIAHDLGAPPERILVESKTPPAAGQHEEYFEGVGMPQTTMWWWYYGYGGVVFAANDSVVRLWVPTNNPNSPHFANSARIYSIHVNYGWGGEIKRELHADARVRIKLWRSEVGLGDSASVEVEMTDVFEPPTIVGRTVTLPENVPEGMKIGSLEPFDGDDCPDGPDGPAPCNIDFTILSGNEANAVAVTDTGDIVVANASAFNFEERTLVAFSAEASDGLLSAFALPRFRIINVNDRPVLQQDAYLTILEESPVNSKVGDALNATDEDPVDNLLFSIVGGNDEEVFKIGGCDGQVRVRRPDMIDYEQVTEYTITVMVVDDGVPPLNATAEVYIEILNRNDPPDIKPQTLYVFENVTLGDEVGAPIQAFDQDGDALFFSIEAGNEFSAFRIDNTTGQLYLDKEGFVDYEHAIYDRHVMDVAVYDGEFSDIDTITVIVLDSNDPPVLLGPQSQFVVPENSMNGTILGTMLVDDQDASDTVEIRIEEVYPREYHDAFFVNENNELEVSLEGAGVIDFEAHSLVIITFSATDSGGAEGILPLTSLANFTVSIQNVNEPPVLTPGQEFFVYENRTQGFVFGTIEVYDDDVQGFAPQDRGLRFESLNGTNPIFALDPVLGTLSIGPTMADFESQSEYEIIIQVSDGGDPPLSDSTIIMVNVLDSNDPPRPSCARGAGWQQARGYDTVRSHTSILPTTKGVFEGNTILLEEFSSFNDKEGRERCHQECINTAGCNGFTYYGGNLPTRGKCYGRRNVNAWDKLSGGFADDVWSGTLRPYCVKFSIDENPSSGLPIGNVPLQDDEGNAIILTHSDSTIPGAVSVTQVGNGAQFKISDETLANHEENPAFFEEILLIDDSGSDSFTREWVMVEVRDVNENPFLHPDDSGIRRGNEGELPGVSLYPPLNFVDPDGDSLTFTMTGNVNGYFALNRTSGLFEVAKELPTVTGSQGADIYTVDVTAEDPFGGETTAQITLEIINVNKRPQLSNTEVVRSIDENSSPDTVVTPIAVAQRISATDPDQGDTLEFTIEAIKPPIPFLKIETVVDGAQTYGILKVNRSDINFEMYSSLQVRVIVTDSYVEAPLSAFEDITVDVVDVPEPPRWIKDCNNSVPENLNQFGTMVNCTVYDPDADSTVLSYTIDTAPYSSMFAVQEIDLIEQDVNDFDPSRCHSFALSFLQTDAFFDYETQSEWTIPVKVSDGQFTTTILVNVDVKDVREAPVVSASTFVVDENDFPHEGRGSDLRIGNITATDEDLDSDLIYTLRSRTDTFIIPDARVPEIYIIPDAKLDFEREEVIAIEVKVEDANDQITGREPIFTIQELTVNVNDVNDIRIYRVEGDEGLDILQLPTATPEKFYIFGVNFGPTLFKVPRGNPRPTPIVTYGGPEGDRFIAQDCEIVLPQEVEDDVGNTKISCDTSQGIGRNLRVRVAFDGASALSNSETVLSYAPPVVTGISGAHSMSTRGGDRVTLEGSNFGPESLPDPIAVEYWLNGLETPFTAKDCEVVAAHTEVSCTTAPGIGYNHSWVVTIGAQSSTPSWLPSQYTPPQLDVVKVYGGGNLTTTGNSIVTIEGDNFGPFIGDSDALRATYGPSGTEYEVGCKLVSAHQVLECDTLPGIGADLIWRVSIGGQLSDTSTESVSYQWPIISYSKPIDGPGAWNASTEGEQYVFLAGSYFGPVTTQLPSSLNVTYWVNYGPSSDPARYTAASCEVVSRDSSIRCVTVPGTGTNHTWQLTIEVCESSGQRCSQQSTRLVAAGTGYGAPVIGAVTDEGQYSPTEGNVLVKIRGVNFGPDASRIETVQFVMEDRSFENDPLITNIVERTRTYQVTDCTMAPEMAHKEIECTMPAGAGRSLRWSMVVDGQWSVTPSYNYMPPSISSVYTLNKASASGMSTAGGEPLFIEGENFGPDFDQFVDSVRYGPTGTEYDITPSCSMTRDHTMLECTTLPGLGRDLAVVVTVAGQRSSAARGVTDVSMVRFHYHEPVIHSIVPTFDLDPETEYVTRGGTRMTISGNYFGPQSLADQVFVHFGGNPSGCFEGQITRACPVVVKHSQTEIIVESPEGQGLDIPIWVECSGQASSKDFTFTYSPPVITALSTEVYSDYKTLIVEGRNFGTSARLLVGKRGAPWDVVEARPMPEGYEFYSHDLLIFNVTQESGNVRFDVGGQVSNNFPFSIESPSVAQVSMYPSTTDFSIPECEDFKISQNSTGGIPPGSTAGGFRVRIDGRHFGDIPSGPTFLPHLLVTVGGKPCPLEPVLRCRENGVVRFADLYEFSEGLIESGTIICEAPPGQGRVPVRVIHAATFESSRLVPASHITYNPPSNVRYTYSDSFFDGIVTDPYHLRNVSAGNEVVISGNDLGSNATILIRTILPSGKERILICGEFPEADCDAGYESVHNSMYFFVPVGGGQNLEVQIMVGDQTHSPLLLSYKTPSFGNDPIVLPPLNERTTQGGFLFTIYGRDFGERYWTDPETGEVYTLARVYVNGNEATECPVWTDTMIQCVMPPGQGKNPDIRVEVGEVMSGRLQKPTEDPVFAPPVVTNGPFHVRYNTSGQSPDGQPGYFVLEGENFGLEGTVHIGGSSFSSVVDTDVVRFYNHTYVVVKVPEGSGENYLVWIETGDQSTQDPTSPIYLSYHPPILLWVTPSEAPTDACHQWDRVYENEPEPYFGTSSEGYLNRPCCRPSMVRIRGANLGPDEWPVIVEIGAGRALENCDALTERRNDLLQSYAMVDDFWTGHLCPANCTKPPGVLPTPDELLWMEEHCFDGHSPPCCMFDQSMDGGHRRQFRDVVLTDPRPHTSCQCPVAAGPCILERSHTEIVLRPPAGFGADLPLQVHIVSPDNAGVMETVGASYSLRDSDLTAAGLNFSYMAPIVDRVDPHPYDANGEALIIEGSNFGTKVQAEGQLRVSLDSLECEDVEWDQDSELFDGFPYLTCKAPRDESGNKSAIIDVGGQISSYEAQERKFWSQCQPGTWGREGEYCLECPPGALCPGFNPSLGFSEDPYSVPGWWRIQPLGLEDGRCPQERQRANATCFLFFPCDPRQICLGDNECAVGYEGERCAQCSENYYRLDGECKECPDNPWVVIVMALVLIPGGCFLLYFLNKKMVNMALYVILLDYVQVLSIFARSRVTWPQIVKDIFQFFSVFNLNIEILSPECAIPDVTYDKKWFTVMLIPIVITGLFFSIHFFLYVYKCLVLRRGKGKRNRHFPVMLSSIISFIYFMYLYLSRTTLDVFNCQVSAVAVGREAVALTFVVCLLHFPGH